jgi:hypothetical protein
MLTASARRAGVDGRGRRAAERGEPLFGVVVTVCMGRGSGSRLGFCRVVVSLDVVLLCRRLRNAERQDAFADHPRSGGRVLFDHKALLRTLGDLDRLDGGDQTLRAHELDRVSAYPSLQVGGEELAPVHCHSALTSLPARGRG